jgi:7-carboxy-7-deazaguanine synthase
MKVVEIFKSIEGEGKRQGQVTTFIRLYGCNLECTYCDTKYACTGDKYVKLTVSEIVQRVYNLGVCNVTVTGGEPLIHKKIDKLLKALVKCELRVNVETNGTIDPTFFDDNLFYTVDVKLPSSGIKPPVVMDLTPYTDKDVLKFVIGSDEDLSLTKKILEDVSTDMIVYLSPVWGFEMSKIAEMMTDNWTLADTRIQCQLHKIIWDPGRRGV